MRTSSYLILEKIATKKSLLIPKQSLATKNAPKRPSEEGVVEEGIVIEDVENAPPSHPTSKTHTKIRKRIREVPETSKSTLHVWTIPVTIPVAVDETSPRSKSSPIEQIEVTSPKQTSMLAALIHQLKRNSIRSAQV